MLLPVWCIFILATWGWGYFADENVSLLSLLWEYRTSFFTSIVIVLFTNTANGINKYKDALWFRHKYYYELMDLFNSFFSCLYSQVVDKKGPYSILLSRKRFNCFAEEIDGKVKTNTEVHTYIEQIKELFVEIKKDNKYDILYSFDGASFDHVNVCMERILGFDDDTVLENIDLFFDLIDNFGWIWKTDIETRIKIDKILHERYGLEGYDDKFLYEIYCCDDITINPFQYIIDSFFPPISKFAYKGQKYVVRKKNK